MWITKTFDFTATSSIKQLTFVGLSTVGGFYIGVDNADVEVNDRRGIQAESPLAIITVRSRWLSE